MTRRDVAGRNAASKGRDRFRTVRLSGGAPGLQARPTVRQKSDAGRLAVRRLIVAGVFAPLFVVWWSSAAALAQPIQLRDRPAMVVPVDHTLQARLRPLDEYVEQEQWNDAYELVQQLTLERGDDLIEVSDGLSWRLRDAVVRRLGAWPESGQAYVRDAVEPIAGPLWQEYQRTGDERLLLRMLERAGFSHLTDRALLELGDQAWRRGELGRAAEFWNRLQPVGNDEPDRRAELSAAVSIRRLMLLLAAGARRPALELSRQLLATADGERISAGGRTATVQELLSELVQRPYIDDGRPRWTVPDGLDSSVSFAGDVSRGGRHTAVSLGPPIWSFPLELPELRRIDSGNRLLRLQETLPGVHVVSDGHRLYASDGWRVLGFELDDGRPAWWPAAEKQSGSQFDRQQATLYSSSSGGAETPLRQPTLGHHVTSLTLGAGRLVARVGAPITGQSSRELRDLETRIVCLDVESAEGRLVWVQSSNEQPEGWLFEGSPVISEGRVVGVMRRQTSQIELAVVCFDLEDGRSLWRTELGAAVTPYDPVWNTTSHVVPTVGASAVFVATDLGAVFSLDPQTGAINWVATYASRFDDVTSEGRRQPRDSVPACYWLGMVMVAPWDADEVRALDAVTGRLLWRSPVPDRIHQILGVEGGCLIVGGASPWGLDVFDGRVLWGNPDPDPEFAGSGRGLLNGTEVWWPTRDRLEFYSAADGVSRRPSLSWASMGGHGGNLAVAGRRLVISGLRQLTVCGD